MISQLNTINTENKVNESKESSNSVAKLLSENKNKKISDYYKEILERQKDDENFLSKKLSESINKLENVDEIKNFGGLEFIEYSEYYNGSYIHKDKLEGYENFIGYLKLDKNEDRDKKELQLTLSNNSIDEFCLGVNILGKEYFSDIKGLKGVKQTPYVFSIELNEEDINIKEILKEVDSRISKSFPKEVKVDQELQDTYKTLLEMFPEGLVGIENSIPVSIDGNELKIIIFNPSYNPSIGLFLEGHRYSRKTLYISKSGQILEDKGCKIPDFDKSDNEPVFTSSDKEIMLKIMEVIKNSSTSK